MDILANFAPESLAVIIWKDFLARAKAGNFAYLPAWLTACVYGEVYRHEPVFFASNTVAFLLMAAYRSSYIKQAEVVRVEKVNATKKVISTIILVNALHWSLTATYLLNSPVEYSIEFNYFVIMLLATFASGGSCNYNPYGKLGVLFSLCIITIPLIFEFIKNPGGGFAYFVIFCILLSIVSQVGNSVQNCNLAAANHFKLLGMYAKTMEELTKLDFLTKLKSHYQFLIDFEVTWHDCVNHKHPIALLSIQLDDLNALSDKHGHHCRDACLAKFAEDLKPRFPAPKLLARYGSEEFILALPNCDLVSAENTAKSILATVREIDFVYNDTQIPLTCSIGVVATHPDLTSNPEAFIQSADKQLQTAKVNGKNCSNAEYVSFDSESH